jgi:hypothetical protein
MIQIVPHRNLSLVIACSDGMRWVRGDTSHGWQDKSADGCRAHVVGWIGIFVTLKPPRAGSISKKHRGVNNVDASRPQSSRQRHEPAR